RRAVRMALERPQTVSFVDEPLEEILSQFKKTLGLWLGFDADAAVARGRKEPVTIDAKSAPLSSILDRILLPLSLDWFINDLGVVMITSREKASGKFETRVYRLRELLQAGWTESELIAKLIPLADDEAGKQPPAYIKSLAGLLMVTQNRRGHEAIEHSLMKLED